MHRLRVPSYGYQNIMLMSRYVLCMPHQRTNALQAIVNCQLVLETSVMCQHWWLLMLLEATKAINPFYF